MRLTLLPISGFACAVVLIVASFNTSFAAPKPDQNQASQPKPAQTATTSNGERKFEIHCGRCHNPPQDLSPKAAPAVLRHMRVRAMITEEDEKAILEYIAP